MTTMTIRMIMTVLTVVVVMEIAMRRDRAVFIFTATQCNTVGRVQW